MPEMNRVANTELSVKNDAAAASPSVGSLMLEFAEPSLTKFSNAPSATVLTE